MSHLSVAGIARREDGSILVMRRLPGGSVGGLWEFPGGKVEPNEEAGEALRREWLEETGLCIDVGEEIARGEFTHKGDTFQLLAYKVTISGDQADPELREHDDFRWIHPQQLDALEMVESDRIVVNALNP